MMTEVMSDSMIICRTVHDSYSSAYGMRICVMQIYSKVSGEPPLEVPTINVSSKVFYGEGYDDSDKRIPDMTIINRQLGRSPSSVSPASNKWSCCYLTVHFLAGWNPKTSLWDLLESTLTYQHRTYAEAIKQTMSKSTATSWWVCLRVFILEALIHWSQSFILCNEVLIYKSKRRSILVYTRILSLPVSVAGSCLGLRILWEGTTIYLSL